MRIPKRLFLACCLSAACLAAFSQDLLPPPLAEALRRAQIPAQAVAVYVQEVGSTPALLAWNEGAPFNPASTMKLVTTDAALETLGPTYTWKKI
jgi:D-alanyl-D-alanine carboxypeptidase/D-alanyl-D-alanine-endopeptidase (penicillin-binding protein 4)